MLDRLFRFTYGCLSNSCSPPTNYFVLISTNNEKMVNFEYGNFENLTSKKCLKSGEHIVTVREGDS